MYFSGTDGGGKLDVLDASISLQWQTMNHDTRELMIMNSFDWSRGPRLLDWDGHPE